MPDVNMTAKLDIAIERVKKLNDPLLVIGLGGTGADMVLAIKQTFAERYELPRDPDGNLIPVPRRTDYLVIDTDTSALSNGFDTHERLDISVLGLNAILDPATRNVNLKPYEQAWVNPTLNASSAGKGAGTYRQAARLMLSRNYSQVRSAILTKLTRLVSVTAGAAEGAIGRVNVVICAGICGGTGSGTFLDVAQIVRDCLKSDHALSAHQSKVTGYLAMPDVSCGHIADPIMHKILKMNGYAALKELDFWMRVGDHKTPYTIQYSDAPGAKLSWDMPPFDACVLMSSISAKGDVYANGYQVMCKTVAENLLHYLAYEEKPDGGAPYTYMSYEDNLNNIVTHTTKTQPLFYGYRSVGAYTKRIPKVDVMYYEGQKLLTTFVPPRDPNGILVPNDQLLKDGNNVLRIGKIVGNINDLVQNVSTHVAMPAFLNTPVENMQNMNPKPHDRADFANPNRWESDILPAAMAKQAEAYLDAAWGKFCEFATAVITDPKQGPFSLRAYLESNAESGFIKGLNVALNDWKSKRQNLEQRRSVLHKACQDAYPTFVKPPLLGKQKAIDAYLEALKRFYSQVRAGAFLDAFVPALSRLVLRVQEYLNTALIPMCEDLEEYHALFSTYATNDDRKLVSNIYDLSAVRDQIDADYVNNNIDNKFERKLLGAMCSESLKTMPNVDPHSSGASFPYQKTHTDVLYSELRKVLDECFGGANGQSLDVIMQQQVGDDVAAQNTYMDELADSVLSSSVPLFSQDARLTNEPTASFSYLSIPDDARKFIDHYTNTLDQKLTPKPSTIKDHLYCMTSWDGLPLYRYSMMEDMELEYCNALGEPKGSMGVHLVYDANPDSSYARNWSKLPEPRPYYLFGSKGTVRAMNDYADVRKVVKDAIACGLVVVDSDVEKPTVTLNLHYVDAQRTTLKPSEMMIPEIDAITRTTDAVTGATIDAAEQGKRIAAYIKCENPILLQPSCSPSILADAMGMAGGNIDPWDPNTRTNPMLLAEAQKNFRALSEELAVAVINMYPMYVLGLKMQLPAMLHATELLAGFEQGQKAWGGRVDYATTFAGLCIHGVIWAGLKSYEYKDKAGQKVKVGDDKQIGKDLQDEKFTVKAVGYLADLNPEHPVRKELAHFLTVKERELEEGLEDETLTADDLNELIENIDQLDESITEERDEYNAMYREGEISQDHRDKLMELYDAIQKETKTQKKNFQRIIKRM